MNNATIYLHDISRCVPLQQPDSLLWEGVGTMFRHKFSKKDICGLSAKV